ncbi:hypothetical protein FOCG_12591 [Fusarium oxysporum f. sp. radicis-lycopersici 26381]|uniref:Uncharacterized protein n=1 Tax=Fusarium oxysporum Fo47 TaxID=660027 RepID=W9JUN6_FUSOX|nr:hypothetical protein FOZG_14496 [Fusarium oxysporum Fo47]EWZ85603.1 hypothetical protein FOWG_10710 [Fusarium oxysporum f. sp. lycopersici MN25]EXL45181.1 hypothetical protein FOCG_12591 [Fusarium oxysporum f. sp. radicis-lycopersici 26381]
MQSLSPELKEGLGYLHHEDDNNQLHYLVLELRIGVESVAESNGQANFSVNADEEKSDTLQDPVDTCAGADVVQKAASCCQEWHQEVYLQSVLGLVNSVTLADHTNQQLVGQRTANKHSHKASASRDTLEQEFRERYSRVIRHRLVGREPRDLKVSSVMMERNAVWCALVLRMICWLSLHNFHEGDILVPDYDLDELKPCFTLQRCLT